MPTQRALVHPCQRSPERSRQTQELRRVGTPSLHQSATPDPGRPVALALTVALWALASTVALYGMRLRPLVILSRPRAASRRARPTGGIPSTGQARVALPTATAERDQDPDVW